MTGLEIKLDQTSLSEFFPFYFSMDKKMKILSAGKSILKLNTAIQGKHFNDVFIIKRPSHVENNFRSFIEFLGQIFILDLISGERHIQMRYECKLLEDQEVLLLIGSPWITSAEDLKKFGLRFRDFALHDSMTDLLQILTVKEINTKEVSDLNKKLQQSEKRYRKIVESASDMIYYTDPEGNLTYVNPVILEQFHITKDEILGRNFIDFVRKDKQEEVYQFYVDKKDFKIPKTYFELPLILRDGSEIWIGQNVTTNLDEKGNVISFISVARDITERKKIEDELRSTELRLRNLIKNMESGILLEDEHRRIVLTNGFFCDLFKIPVAPDKLTGMDCSQSAEQSKGLFKNPNKFVARIDKILADKKPVLAENIEMIDGKYLERDFIPITFRGKYLGHLWQYRDVTVQRNNEKVLIEAKREAERAQKAEEYFIARMSHEIRTPLNAVVGMTHLLKDSPLDEEQEEYLQILESSAEILQQLISDILDLSKISAGHVEINETEFDLNKNLDDIINSFKIRAPEKSLELLLLPDEKISQFIKADKLILNQILINLLSNAFKFTEAGNIKLQTKLVNEKNNIQTVEFSVSDTGIGISPKNQKRVFQKFKQAEAGTNEKYGGTGLGLYIVSQLVELLGGKLSLESEVGKGSTFRLKIPVKKSNKIITSDSSRILDSQTLTLKVLVAEDNLMNQKLISRLLEKWSYTFDIVSNGVEALQKLNTTSYDILLLDLQMPVMDGFETSKRIRVSDDTNIKEIPIIALTASALSDYKKESELIGIDEFVSKPFKPEILKSKMVDLVLDKKGTSKNTETKKSELQLDKSYLEDFYGGDLEYAEEMFQLFIEHTLGEYRGLENLIEKNDYEEARKLIHKIAPNFTMIGASGIGDELNVLKEMIKKDDNKNSISDKQKTIDKQFNNILPLIKMEHERLINIQKNKS